MGLVLGLFAGLGGVAEFISVNTAILTGFFAALCAVIGAFRPEAPAKA